MREGFKMLLLVSWFSQRLRKGCTALLTRVMEVWSCAEETRNEGCIKTEVCSLFDAYSDCRYHTERGEESAAETKYSLW